MGDDHTEIIEQILEKIPRPNFSEMPALYIELDEMSKVVGEILIKSNLFDKQSKLIRFDKASADDIFNLIKKNPNVMIPFFVMICGFSVRELERLASIKNIYSLRKRETFNTRKEIAKKFSIIIKENLKYPLHLETVIYKFYKNWEEHQKRHFRAKIEDKVRKFLNEHGYACDKIKIICKGKEIEIDVAIPPDPNNIKVAIQVRTGVRRDLVKRAKEFSSEYDDIIQCIPGIKFIPAYFVSPHEKDKLEEFRRIIINERQGKPPYAAVILTWNELENLLNLLPKWGIHPNKSNPST